MNRVRKGIILVLMLAIPVGIILFLHSFGRNEYDLPVFHEQGLESCQTGTVPHTITDFSLFSPISGNITNNILDGRITVVNFFEVPCTANCPDVFDELANLQNIFADEETVKTLSISRGLVLKDTLLNFIEKYQSDPDKWLFLMEKQARVLDLAKCGFGLGSFAEGHALETVVLVDGEKRIRGYYNISDPDEADRLVLEIRILLRARKT